MGMFGIEFVAMFLTIILGFTIKRGLVFLIGGFIMLFSTVQILLDGNQMSYISNGTSIPVSGGEYFLFIPIIMAVLCFILPFARAAGQ